MKVKAKYSISCDKGYFEAGEAFEIDAKDLPMYGDAVTVAEEAKERREHAEPREQSPGLADAKQMGLSPGSAPDVPAQEPEAEKPKTTRTRKRRV